MTIQILGWEGYDDPFLTQPFKQAGGSNIVVDPHLSDFAATQRVLGTSGRWDLVNINSPFVREVLYARGRVQQLDKDKFEAASQRQSAPAGFKEFYQWGLSPDGNAIGVCQRFGPFNFVVNSAAISIAMAEDQGFKLAADPKFAGRYGILAYDDFNVFHMAIASGFDPFQNVSEHALAAFTATASRWFKDARFVTPDYNTLNQALIDRTIDFYLSGGIYTASSARRDGNLQICAVTPRSGPIQGRGGIAFVEVNAALTGAPSAWAANAFLEYLAQPATAVRASLAARSANPVLQMSDPAVFSHFSPAHLKAMQWGTLEEDVNRCAQYRVAPDYERMHAILAVAKTAAGWMH
jgi:spermidine/putrescine transport system substrate-binding protein